MSSEANKKVFGETRTSVFYLVEEEGSAGPLLLKTLRERNPGQETLDAFENELSFSGIEPVSGLRRVIGATGEENEILLEYIEGETLEKWAHSHTSLLSKLRMAAMLSGTLARIHNAGIIYRNFSQEHIIIQPDGTPVFIDLMLATRVAGKVKQTANAVILANPDFISPEFTGRINRVTDQRSDLYSLGTLFYWLFAGVPPFRGADLLEKVHAHIAINAAPFSEVNSELPKQLWLIVSRLMSKNPDARYQSAYGVMHDLEKCCLLFESGGAISEFEPGSNDYSGTLRNTHKVFGRENEIAVLNDAFQNAVQGQKALVTVYGFSGIGKTAVVQELIEPVYHAKSTFISGKFDRYQRDVPYFGINEALSEFVDLVISRDEDAVKEWKERIHEACFPIGQVLVDLCPGLEILVGEHPDLPELNGIEAQNRFNYALIMFMKTLATADHPLVLFLDDVQWADSSSLHLIKLMMTEADLRHLLIIFSYRENEVNEAHPVSELVREVAQSGSGVREIPIGQMPQDAIRDMIEDMMQTKQENIAELSEVVFHKSQGNALFIHQFLKSAAEDKVVSFDFSQHRWVWDKEAVVKRNISGDIEELLTDLLNRLPEDTLQILRVASVFGAEYKYGTLSRLLHKKEAEVKKQIREALIHGLVLETGDSLVFAHDRIQHLLYEQLPEHARNQLHLELGRILILETKNLANPENIFDILFHWNEAVSLLENAEEKDKFTYLCLIAGKKAKASAAYAQSMQYFTAGLKMLPENPWQNNYETVLELSVGASEAAYLNGDHIACETLIQDVLSHAENVLDKVRCIEIRMQSAIAQNKPEKAIGYGMDCLEELGAKVPRKPGQMHVISGLIASGMNLRGKKPEDILKLAPNTDVKARAVMNVLYHMLPAAYFAMPNIVPIVIFRLLKLTLDKGVDSKSPYAFLGFGYLQSAFMGKVAEGDKYADLALALHDKMDTKPLSASLYSVCFSMVKPWRMHWKDTLEPLAKGFKLGLENGDAEFTSYLAHNNIYTGFYVGNNLTELMEQSGKLFNQVAVFNQDLTLKRIQIFRQSIADLIEEPAEAGELNGEFFNDQNHVLTPDPNNFIFFQNLYMQKMALAIFYRDREKAWKYAAEAGKYLESVRGSVLYPQFIYYQGIAAAEIVEIHPEFRNEAEKILKKSIKEFKKYEGWSIENFGQKLKLLEALQLSHSKAYEKSQLAFFAALRQARQHQFPIDEILIWELTGEFYLQQGQDQVAIFYLQNAYHMYHHWGAFGKCRQLADKFHHLNLVTDKHNEPHRHEGQDLDLATVVKAYNVLSGEIILSSLIEKIMHIMVENAGAQRGVLIREQDGERTIQAILNKGDERAEILLNESFAQTNLLSRAVVNYTANSDNYVVIDNAQKTRPYNNDAYILNNKVLSVICLPVRQKGKLFGYLYLENNLVPGVFTPSRISLLNLLSTQAAVSLENAELYDDLSGLNSKLKQEIHDKELAQKALEENEKRLEEYNATLEQKVEERTQEIMEQKDLIEAEKAKSDRLLLNILPAETAEELKIKGTATPRRFENVTVLFTDFVNFSKISENISADVLVNEIHFYYSAFDAIITKYGLEKIKTIGDSYMCAAGLPTEDPEHAIKSVMAAREIAEFVEKTSAEREKNGQIHFQIRIGLHSGAVVAGIVGTRKFAFDIWGDTVNVASRMESNSEPGKINITGTTYELVKKEFNCAYRGKISVKNKGEIDQYFVEGLAAVASSN